MFQKLIFSKDTVQRARLISWVMTFFCCVSLAFNVLLVLTMFQMGGRLTVMTHLVSTIRGTDTLVLTDVLNKDIAASDLFQKAFIHRYVEEKNFRIPDMEEMLRRWGWYGDLQMMSHPSAFKPVGKNDDEIKDVPDLPATYADNIQIISKVGNSWRVSFDLWIVDKDETVFKKKEATIITNFFSGRVQTVARPGFFYNPLGMTVVKYFATDKE